MRLISSLIDRVTFIHRPLARLCGWTLGVVLVMGLVMLGFSARSAAAFSVDTMTSSIDTGAFAPGYRNFSGFTNPRMCVAAVRQATAIARRALAVRLHLAVMRDTAPQLDTLPQTAIALARQCSARFTVAKTAPRDLSALLTLTLQAGQDSLGHSIIARQLALAPDANTRQDLLADASQIYVDAEPTRLSDAEWVAALADSLAKAEHTNSLPAHMPLMDAARAAFDRPRLLKEAHTLIALGNTLDFTAIQYKDIPVITAWMQVLAVTFFDHPDSVLALAQQAKVDLSRFPIGKDFPNGVPYSVVQAFDFAKASVPAVRDVLLPFNPQQYTGTRVLPPVRATYWFPSPPSVWPPKGKVSLVIYGGWIAGCVHRNMLSGTLSRGFGCLPLYTYLRDWSEQLESQGFALTMVLQTEGSAVRSVPLTAREEADSIEWFFRTHIFAPREDTVAGRAHLQSPWTIGVVPRAIVRQVTPSADGRRWLADTTEFGHAIGAYNLQNNFNNGLVLLYDRSGTLLYAGDRLENALLHAFIVRALAEPKTATAKSATAQGS